ncbi:MAG: sugar transferase [Actinomycetota bacterium]|nr:sugar transferase [Actinomycetota bacterium]
MQLGVSRAATEGNAQSPTLPPLPWERAYRRRVVIADVITIVVGMWFGLFLLSGSFAPGPRAALISAVTGMVLLASLALRRSWDLRILGQGADEFRRVSSAVATAVVILGLGGLITLLDDLRPWVFAIVPTTGVAMGVARYGLRKALHARRARSTCMVPVLAAGSEDEVADLIARTRRETHNGWLIEAACIPAPTAGPPHNEIAGVPVVGSLDDVAARAHHGGYRIVVAVPHPSWTRGRLRDLAWQLENTAADLVVAPTLMEVSGPRLHFSPVYGLTLLRVSKPSLSGVRWLLKASIDRVGALCALVVLAPVLLAVALAIKLEDRGPVLFRQERVGKGGTSFMMVKFRSMVVDAEARLAELTERNEGAGPLFKIRADPRVTRVGRLLRRYSIDELPQLINVAAGHMSLIGPRPPLPVEVSCYATDALRRLLVKPGVTGLWQISGRSDLSWEESVRLDLRYVENWSLALDVVILWKTVSAVVRRAGAY